MMERTPSNQRWTGCLSLALMWLVAGAAFAAERQPPILELDPDDDSLIINVFDIVSTRNGKVLYVNPKQWSKKNKRPVNFEDIDGVLCVPWDRAKGGSVYPKKSIDKIEYWEHLATQQAVQLIIKEDYGTADKLVRKLESFNPDWSGVAGLRARIEARRATYKIEGLGKVQEGITDLEALRRRFPGDAHVEHVLVSALVKLGTEALSAEDPDYAGDQLERAERLYPNNTLLRETRSQWRAEANELIVTAERTQKSDSGVAIAKAQRVVRLTNDTNLRRRARIVIRNAEGLLLASYEDPGAFEPMNATRPIERQIVRLMYDFLMERDETATKYGKSPMVSQIREKSLGRQYEIVLNKQLRFSDGSPLTAADVAASIGLLKDPNGDAYDAEWSRFVDGAQLLSPFALRVDVNPHPRPDSLLYFPVVSRTTFSVLPRRGSKEARNPTVSGPYRLNGVYANGNVELIANGLFRSPPQIGKITFRRYNQRGTGHAVNDLLQGRIHTISDPSPAQIERIRSVPASFATKRTEPNNVWVLAINHDRAIFSDTKNPRGPAAARDLRGAIAKAIDRQGILNQYFNLGGKAKMSHAVISGPFPRQSPAYDRTVVPRQANPAAAKALVNRYQGLLNGKLVLKYADQGDVVESAMAEIMRNLVSVGFEIDLQKRPANAFLRDLRSGSFDLAYYRIEHDNVLFNIANLFDSSPQAMASGQNFMRYSNQGLTQMFEELRLAKEGEQIWATQNQIHRFVNTESVVIPLWQLDTYFAYTRRLVGRTREGASIDLPIDSSHIFRNVDQWYLKPIE